MTNIRYARTLIFQGGEGGQSEHLNFFDHGEPVWDIDVFEISYAAARINAPLSIFRVGPVKKSHPVC